MSENINDLGLFIKNENPGKKGLKTMALKAVEDFLEDGRDLFEIAEMIAKMELFIKEIRADQNFTNAVVNDVEKMGSRYEMGTGTKIEKIESGVKYDFLNCGDPIYNRLFIQKNELDLQLKNREAWLKLIPISGEPIIDEETGEMVRIYPPAKSSTTTYKITIPNN